MNLTFKGFLRSYCRELTNIESDNLKKLLVKTLKDSPSAAEALMVFAAVQGKADYLVSLAKGTKLEDDYKEVARDMTKAKSIEAFFQGESAPERYKKVWNAYLGKRDAIKADRRVILLMREKTLNALPETELTTYKIAKSLKLNIGNLYAYLNAGDATKVSRDTARKIMEFVQDETAALSSVGGATASLVI